MYPAWRAIDGKTYDYEAPYGGISHTCEGSIPWWRVDLNKSYSIVEIVIWNREDCCSDKLSNSKVEIILENKIVDTKTIGNTSGKVTITFNYSGVVGDAVRIQATTTTAIHVTEVQVFAATFISNVALEGSASQSCVYKNNMYPAWRAIDGKTYDYEAPYGGISHTCEGSIPWWRVDLNKSYSIVEIVIWNREDCCSDKLSNSKVEIILENKIVDTKTIGNTSG